jgi:hypothetical protein
VLASHNVDVITLDGMVELVWPRHLKCSHAGCALQRAPLSPLALGLVAANPSGKNVLFDIRVIELVKELTQGVSTLSFEGALGARARAFGVGADAHKTLAAFTDALGKVTRAKFNDEQLRNAFFSYIRRVALRATTRASTSE